MKHFFLSNFKIYLLVTVLVFFCSVRIYAQSFMLAGVVKDSATQKPVGGAEVRVQGFKSTVTNDQGEFRISCTKGSKLIVKGFGYRTETVDITQERPVVVMLAQSSLQLQDVVITATGIKKDAKQLGYSTQTVDASQFMQAKEPDPMNALKGQVAGLEININSEIGHSPDVIVRGENNSNDRPMFVVDGVPISTDTYNVNPDDIETFTVLKGPSAAALYGFQGKNGAIIISTKKGAKSKNRVSINLNSSTQFDKGFIALPKQQDEYGPGENGKYAFGGGGSNVTSYFGNQPIGTGLFDYDYDIWGPQFRGQLIPQYDGTYTPTQTYTTTFADGSTYTGNVEPTPWLARGKNNLRNFIQTGILSSNSLSLGYSNDKTDVRISFGNTYQQGIVPNTKLNNANFTTSIVYRFTPDFSVSSYFNYSRQSTPNIPDVGYGPNSIIYNIAIWGGADWSVKDMRNYWQDGKTGIQEKYAEYYRYNNPYFMSYQWLRSHYQNNEYGYVSFNYKPSKNWEIVFRPSMNAYDMFNSEKLPYSATVYGRPMHMGDYREDRRQQFETNVEAQIRYNRTSILGFLDLQGLGGANVRNFGFNSDYTTTNYLIVPGIYAFSNSLNPLQGTSYRSSMLVLSAYYSFDIGFKSYLLGNITGRVDKSSSMPTNSNSYFYPSFSLASVLSDYLKLPEVVSFLKLRASYAQSKSGGTNAFFSPNLSNVSAANGYGYTWQSPYGGPSYQFQQSYTLAPTYSSQISAQYADYLINSQINTADRKATEFGMDIRFLKNKIGLEVTRYHYRNTGIVNQGISAASGYSSVLTNGDIYTNDGWEAVLKAKPVSNPNGFSWDITANFSTYIRKWVQYNSAPNNWVYSGKRVDLVYGNAFVRTPAGQMVIDPTSGLFIRYSDLGSTAQKVFGHSDPDWQWGLVNAVSYKSFSLHFQFDGIVGGVMDDYVRDKTLQSGRHAETAQGAFGAARPSDEAGIPAYTGNGVNLTGQAIALDPINGNITNYSSLTETKNTTKSLVQPFVYNMSSIADLDIIKKTYVKLREVTFAYKLPETIFGKKSFFQSGSVSVVGRNLLYFFPSRYKDLDVDQYTQGSGSSLQTPTTRNFGFNLNLTF